MPGLPAPTDTGLSTSPRSRRRRRLRRILIAVGVSLLLLVGFVAAGGAFFLHRLESAFVRGSLIAPDARAGAHPLSGPLNFLLIGSDYRTVDPQDGQRSDTIIIAHVDAGLDHVDLVSVPRDLRVDIPPDPDHGFDGGTQKINSAFSVDNGGPGGIQLLSRTLTNLTGVRFDGGAAIKFDGLRQAVDMLGGVNMCVDTAITSIHTGRKFAVGCKLMSSAEALDYLRQRDQYADGDYTRQRHQQQFLKAMLQRAANSGMLTNPVRLDQFVRAFAGAMTVDPGAYSMFDLAYGLRGIPPDQLTGIKVPSNVQVIDGESFVVGTPDAQGLYAALRDDRLADWTSQNKQWVNRI
jgi:LCP family protein required for cell wall assembly